MKTFRLKLYSSLVGVNFFLAGISSADLLIYYPFNSENGTTLANNGTQENGTLVGGATYGTSKDTTFGKAFYGNRTGANDGYVQTGLTGTELGMGPDSVYTAMAWVNWTGSGGNVDHMVFGQEDGPGNAPMLHHGIRDDSPANVHYGGWGNDTNDAGTVTPGEWTHLAWSFDGADKVVFVNGVETAREAGSTMTGHALPVIVGGHGRDAADPAGQSFNGAIDEVKIWDEALTLAQIQAAMSPTADSGDTDQDGLSDEDEVNVHSTDPNDADSDDDGLNDGVEVSNGLDPNDSVGGNGPDGDLDSDGLSNIDEIEEHFTDPKSDDSDEDGLKDKAEIETHNTDPNDQDSDGDTLTDGEEVNSHNTDPNLADSDNDGYSDSTELQFGTDPTLAESVPSTQELLVYYDFNGQAADQMGNAPNASLLVDASITIDGQGASGAAGDEALDLAFPGDGSMAMVDIGDHFEKINGTNAVAVSFWQFNTGATQSSSFWLIAPDAGNNFRGFQAHTPWSNGTVYVDVAGCCDPGRLTVGGVVIENQWQHFVFQRKISGDLEIWVDGIKVAEKPNVPDLLPLDGSFTIGGEPNTANSFSGRIDDLAVYSDALDEEQITALANGTNPIELFGGGSAELAITAISYEADTDQVSLTWNSRGQANYSIDMSETLGFDEWEEVIDDIPSQGDTTTVQLPALTKSSKLFFRVRQVR